MRLFRTLCFATALALVATASRAALTLVLLGSKNQASATTNVLTTATNDCPIGSLIVVQATYTTIADTLSSVTDNVGNTYQTPIDNVTTTGIGQGWSYAINTSFDLAVAKTITSTFGGSTVSSVQAYCIGGASTTTPLDTHNNSSTGLAASSATTVNTGTLANSSEIVMGGIATATGTGGTTCNGSYTKLAFNNTPSLSLCYLIVASTASNAFSPTWVTANNYVSDVISFQAPGAGGGTTSSNLTTMGAGP